MRVLEVLRRRLSHKELIGSVNAKDLTVEGLASIHFPESSLISIWVSFQSKGLSPREYTAIHIAQSENGPYIHLSGDDKDTDDFRSVAKAIAEITKGYTTKDITDRGSDLCQAIRQTNVPTQQLVRRYINKYAALFTSVHIPYAYYSGVPFWAYKRVKLAEGSLLFNENK